MSKLPNPPGTELLCRIGAEPARVAAGRLLFRIYFRGGDHPAGWREFRHFGPLAGARFDHHPEPRGLCEGYGVLYAATEIKTCVAEVFQTDRTIGARRREPWLAGFELREEIELLDLTSNWPTRAGASMKISSGPRPTCRRWSRAVYEAYPEIAGLSYSSSMNANRPAVALYERAEPLLATAPSLNVPLSHPGLTTELDRIATDLGYSLVP